VEEQNRHGPSLLQQNPKLLTIVPNIPEVWTEIVAYHRLHGSTPPHSYRLPVGALIRKEGFVHQYWWEAGLTEIFA